MIDLLGKSEFASAPISYVPELLPDELLYSWIGRLICVNALGYPKDCLLQLFGSRNVIPCVDLPTLLQPLQQRLGDSSPLDSTVKLLELGTLYPYHRPFLNNKREQPIRDIMFNHDGKGLKVLMGRVANRFGANPPLRFCSKCIKEDTEIYGTPYWKRAHQLPGVTCCFQHQVLLTTYVSPSLIIDRQRYILPPYLTPFEKPTTISKSQFDFAVISNELLQAGLPPMDPAIRKHVYKEAAIAAGCGSRLHRVDYASLAMCIKEHYNDFSGFVHQQRLLSSARQPLSWLHTLIDRPERSTHPICHLLLIGYLFCNIDTFTKLIKSYQNMDSFSYVDLSKVESKTANEHVLIQDISLSCRQVAKLLNLSTTTVVCKRRQLNIPINERRKTLNIGLINNINLDFFSGVTLKEIASRNHVSLATVYRLRAQSKELIRIYHDLDLSIKNYRKRWLQLILDYPKTGSTILRRMSPAVYAWLYRHDKDWLTKTNLCLKPIITSNLRIDWAERDRNLSQHLRRHVDDIRKLNDRPRISKTLMLRVVGDAMVRNNLERLPILEKHLNELMETQLEFQMFRIDVAIDRILKLSEPLYLSKIQRNANIKNLSHTLKVYAHYRINSLTNTRIYNDGFSFRTPTIS